MMKPSSGDIVRVGCEDQYNEIVIELRPDRKVGKYTGPGNYLLIDYYEDRGCGCGSCQDKVVKLLDRETSVKALESEKVSIMKEYDAVNQIINGLNN